MLVYFEDPLGLLVGDLPITGCVIGVVIFLLEIQSDDMKSKGGNRDAIVYVGGVIFCFVVWGVDSGMCSYCTVDIPCN